MQRLLPYLSKEFQKSKRLCNSEKSCDFYLATNCKQTRTLERCKIFRYDNYIIILVIFKVRLTFFKLNNYVCVCVCVCVCVKTFTPKPSIFKKKKGKKEE